MNIQDHNGHTNAENDKSLVHSCTYVVDIHRYLGEKIIFEVAFLCTFNFGGQYFLRGTKMNIQDHNGHTNAENDKSLGHSCT